MLRENLTGFFVPAVESQKMARGLKFLALGSRGFVLYLCSENKSADHLRGICTADLRFFFRLWFSHDAAQMISLQTIKTQIGSTSAFENVNYLCTEDRLTNNRCLHTL